MSDFAAAVKEAEMKSDFNDRVQAERGEGLAGKPVIPKPPSTIVYKVEEGDATLESWPTVFKWTPQIGDTVASESDRTLKITDITHRFGGVVQITLGRETGGISPSGGGGGAEEDLL